MSPQTSRGSGAVEFLPPTPWRRLRLNRATRVREHLSADASCRIDEYAYPRGTRPPRRYVARRAIVVAGVRVWAPIEHSGRSHSLAAAKRLLRAISPATSH